MHGTTAKIRLKVFENRVLRKMFGPKKEEVTRHRREVHNEEVYDLYSLPYVIWMVKSRRISCGGASGREAETHTWSWLGRLKEDHLVDMGVDDRTVLNRMF